MKIKDAQSAQLDLVSLGECMIRLSPQGHGRIEFSNLFEAHVGGGEYNVAYAAARLGLRTGWISRLVDNPLGHLILQHARAGRVDVSNVVMAKYDGVGKADRIGLNFTEVGVGVRGSVTLYDRGHSAASHLKPDEVNWKSVFAGARWLHTGGIFTALSDSCAETVRAAMQAAHDAGTLVSYDLNFRGKLWSSAQAQKITRDLVNNIDFLIGNEEDFEKVLGFEIEGAGRDYSSLDPAQYKKMVGKVVKAYPHLKGVATTLREVTSGLLNNWSAILWHAGRFYQSRVYKNLEIEDRVGGGDGFSAGVVYGFLTGMSPQETVELGAAHGALLQTTRGDTSQVTLEEVNHVMGGGSARIKR
ncbi:MAG: sugar kinase [Verrucomicrobia bacterium]|nr:sugar kinase [Verrucomicrobiota bacterium]